MTNGQVTELVAIGAGLIALVAFVALVLVPVASSYQRVWERIVAGVLSLYVLAAFIGIGVLAGAVIVYYWPKLF